MKDFPNPLELPLREIWPQLQALDPHIQIIGGYGLLLKQLWLGQETGTRCLIPLETWTKESRPRTTRDMDMGVSPAVIASPDKQAELQEVLKASGYEYSDGKRLWGLFKQRGVAECVELEFHAPLPDKEWEKSLRTDERRIKPLHSLGYGIHGRTNPELIGFEHHFSFPLYGLSLTIPNVLTAAMMKLAAFENRWIGFVRKPEDHWSYSQAQKHARDLYRIVSMETEEEAKGLPKLREVLRVSPLFVECRRVLNTYFLEEGQEGYAFVQGYWPTEAFASLREELRRWWEI